MIVGMAVPTTVRSRAATAIAVMIPTVRIICVRVSGGMGSPAGPDGVLDSAGRGGAGRTSGGLDVGAATAATAGSESKDWAGWATASDIAADSRVDRSFETSPDRLAVASAAGQAALDRRGGESRQLATGHAKVVSIVCVPPSPIDSYAARMTSRT